VQIQVDIIIRSADNPVSNPNPISEARGRNVIHGTIRCRSIKNQCDVSKPYLHSEGFIKLEEDTIEVERSRRLSSIRASCSQSMRLLFVKVDGGAHQADIVRN